MTADLPTHPSTEAVGEGRRDKPELIVAAIQENLRAIGEDSLTGLGWLPPAAHVQLRSDLSAMTSDRDWLRTEFEKAAATVEAARSAEKRLRAALIACAPYLDQPFTNAPHTSPWDRSIRPAMTRLREALHPNTPVVDTTGDSE